MSVTLAKSAGFCYGVRRAVELAQEKAAQSVYMLGPVIHNDHVIRSLEEQGAVCAGSVEEIPAGATVIIRSHGESQAVHQALAEKGACIADATCPNVARIHQIVREAEERGRTPVISWGPPTTRRSLPLPVGAKTVWWYKTRMICWFGWIARRKTGPSP